MWVSKLHARRAHMSPNHSQRVAAAVLDVDESDIASIEYVDADGETCTIASDEAVDECIRVAREGRAAAASTSRMPAAGADTAPVVRLMVRLTSMPEDRIVAHLQAALRFAQAAKHARMEDERGATAATAETVDRVAGALEIIVGAFPEVRTAIESDALPPAVRSALEVICTASPVFDAAVDRVVAAYESAEAAGKAQAAADAAKATAEAAAAEATLEAATTEFVNELQAVIDLPARLLAQALTASTVAVMSWIGKEELMDLAWSRKATREEAAPGVTALIGRHNMLFNLVSASIVGAGASDHCAVAPVLEHWIAVAGELRKVGNYNDLMAVSAGLQSAPVFRLKAAWAEVSPAALAARAAIGDLMTSSRSYAVYRAEVREADAALPYLGVALTDLTFIHEGNKDPEVVARRSSAVFAELKRQVDGAVERLDFGALSGVVSATAAMVDAVLASCLEAVSEEALYRDSLAVEPRGGFTCPSGRASA